MKCLSSKHVKLGHYRPASETPSGWRFAGGPIVARDGMLAGSFCLLTTSLLCMEIMKFTSVNSVNEVNFITSIQLI